MDPVGLIYLILAIALIGLCLYLIETYIPMDPIFKTAIRIIIVVVVILYLITWLAPLIGGHSLSLHR